MEMEAVKKKLDWRDRRFAEASRLLNNLVQLMFSFLGLIRASLEKLTSPTRAENEILQLLPISADNKRTMLRGVVEI